MKLIMLNSGWLVGHSRKGIQGPACWQDPVGAEGSPAQLRAQQHLCSGSGLQDEYTSLAGCRGNSVALWLSNGDLMLNENLETSYSCYFGFFLQIL